jgi:hypothetical protein
MSPIRSNPHLMKASTSKVVANLAVMVAIILLVPWLSPLYKLGHQCFASNIFW